MKLSDFVALSCQTRFYVKFDIFAVSNNFFSHFFTFFSSEPYFLSNYDRYFLRLIAFFRISMHYDNHLNYIFSQIVVANWISTD